MAEVEDLTKVVTLQKRGSVAIITLAREHKLNACTQDIYYRIACLLHEVAAMDDIYVTVLTAKGRFFSAGADVSISRGTPEGVDVKAQWLKSFVANNMHTTHAFYTHPKILITALNGPAVGLSAAIVAMSDFVYAAPHTFLLTPFTSLGLVAEGGASAAFVKRLGISKANEALIMSKRITCQELVQTGFVNKVFDVGNPKDSDKFLEAVLKEVDERLGSHLNQDSLLGVKALIRRQDRDNMDIQGVHEVFAGLDRFVKGIPQKEFELVASGKKKHKL
ncbi:peroxisomal d3,d2-enoyl-CoA isomeras-like protein [Aulographum hederae CBS 113979]|uniref:Peroxisomal d3,d2-enoyl-CoA isomeras-like protein n=1 Tax=Aulographum hederae CBS 113979 TaxID=1176131 RepID=A0A6G1HA63_9PEZI|nr:peroxisomal d3,d2-enoyl-CoA isomeras-like protein [Aulographum hederae CBS 113979]